MKSMLKHKMSVFKIFDKLRFCYSVVHNVERCLYFPIQASPLSVEVGNQSNVFMYQFFVSWSQNNLTIKIPE